MYMRRHCGPKLCCPKPIHNCPKPIHNCCQPQIIQQPPVIQQNFFPQMPQIPFMGGYNMFANMSNMFNPRVDMSNQFGPGNGLPPLLDGGGAPAKKDNTLWLILAGLGAFLLFSKGKNKDGDTNASGALQE